MTKIEIIKRQIKLHENMKACKFEGSIPKCTTHADYMHWLEAARLSKPNPKLGFCQDCTFDYQSSMIQQRKCENPGVAFQIDESGMEEGTLPCKNEVLQSDLKRLRSRLLREVMGDEDIQ